MALAAIAASLLASVVVAAVVALVAVASAIGRRCRLWRWQKSVAPVLNEDKEKTRLRLISLGSIPPNLAAIGHSHMRVTGPALVE